MVALDTGATANLVCFKWLGNHNSFLRKIGHQNVMPYSTMARLKFGDGRVGELKHAADIKDGTAGRRAALAAFALEADIPAFLRKKASWTHWVASWILSGAF